MKPPFFRVRRTQLNGIISPPYPEVTLDNFGFPVGGRLAARRAQKRCFWPEINFLWTSSKKIVTIMTGPLKDNLFVLTALQAGLRGAVRDLFWAEK